MARSVRRLKIKTPTVPVRNSRSYYISALSAKVSYLGVRHRIIPW